MPSKENYCYWILRKYSLVVEFSGTPSEKSVPDPIPGERYGQWKRRVLGDEVSDVALYVPFYPDSDKKIEELQDEAGVDLIKEAFSSLKKAKDAKAELAINKAVQVVNDQFVSFPKETLEDLIDEMGDDLQPSVKEFFDRFSKAVDSRVDVENMLKELIM